MILHFRDIFGLRLFRLGRFQVELWVVPAHSSIPAHYHRFCDSHIIHLWGKAWFMVDYRCKFLHTFTGFWSKEIPRNINHAAVTQDQRLIFLNIETWHEKPTSAATDFVLKS